MFSSSIRNKDDSYVFISCYESLFRSCITCERKFGSERGLKCHLAVTKDCGTAAKKVQKAKEIKKRLLRNEAIRSLPMRRIGQHKKSLAVPHKRGAPLSKAEKETILHTYESFKSTYKAQCEHYEILLSTWVY